MGGYAPAIKREFGVSNADYGWLVAAFSVAYGLSAPLMGIVIDRFGLRRGTAVAVVSWSLVGAVTGSVHTFGQLLGCRALLGVSEAAGIPASGKAYATYLPASERALGAALGQVGITLGSAAAPLIASRLPWRPAFLLGGALGLLWAAGWILLSRSDSHREGAPGTERSVRSVLADRRVWGLCAANVFAMVTYSLWTNWTTIYLVKLGLTPAVANARFAWLPPVCGSLGGFAGGWLSWKWAKRAKSLQTARWNVCAASAVLLLPTALLPATREASWATVGICISFFFTLAISVNIYAMPLDLFGSGRAAFATSLLTSVYGLMQWPLSPSIGWSVDRFGFSPVCVTAAFLPIVAVTILRLQKLHE